MMEWREIMAKQQGGTAQDKLQKMREIIKVLPQFNRGLCGFGNCGNYARALVEGKAAPNLCIGGYLVAQKICSILGIRMPAMPQRAYFAQPRMQYYGAGTSVARTQERQILQQRTRELAQQLANLERRIEALATRKENRR